MEVCHALDLAEIGEAGRRESRVIARVDDEDEDGLGVVAAQGVVNDLAVPRARLATPDDAPTVAEKTVGICEILTLQRVVDEEDLAA